MSLQSNTSEEATRDHVVVVDGQQHSLRLIMRYLERQGYRVSGATEAEAALREMARLAPAIIVCDVAVTDGDGSPFYPLLGRHVVAPIIPVLHREDVHVDLAALGLLPEHCFVTPASLHHLRDMIERARMVERVPVPANLEFGALYLDMERQIASLSGQPLPLTPVEFRLLAVLAGAPGRVFSRTQLLQRVQGKVYDGYERTINTHIKNLRQKLGDSIREPTYVLTVYGMGYKFVDVPVQPAVRATRRARRKRQPGPA